MVRRPFASSRVSRLLDSCRRRMWWAPLIACVIWASTLYMLLTQWIRDGRPHVGAMQHYQKIPFISDIGALPDIKPMFVLGSVTTAVIFQIAIIAHWSQTNHEGPLQDIEIDGETQSPLSKLAPIAGSIGCAFAVFVPIFDVVAHFRLHILVFLLSNFFFTLNASLMCYGIYSYVASQPGIGPRPGVVLILNKTDPGGSHTVSMVLDYLRLSFWIRVTTTTSGMVCCVVAATCVARHADVAAISEWVMAIFFGLYMLTFSLDIYIAPKLHAAKTKV